ncbi:MAG: hypothetical protein ACE5R6_14100 [Candidatus Heimdallarchaeota archaeon]
MALLHDILLRLKTRSAQKYLDQSDSFAQKLEGLFTEVEETPPQLNRILCVLDSDIPRCIDAGLFALNFTDQFKTDLYLLHKGILGPLILEQAVEFQETVVLDQEVDSIEFDEIVQFVEEYSIDLIITSGNIPFATRLLSELSIPILFTKHHMYSQSRVHDSSSI